MEMLTAALAVLCALLTLVLLIQRPSIWPVLLALVVAWGICMAAFRYQLRRWLSRWVRGDNFEKSKTKFSLEQLSQPTALLSGETVLWYNEQFRARLLGGQDMLTSRVQKVLPGLDLQQCRTQQGQLLTLADGFWSVHSSTVPGGAECMTLLVLNEETALRKIEAEYKASRPGYLVFLVDGYDDVFGDMLDSERARLLEGINRILEDMIGRGSGFLRRVASGRYIAVVEERQMEQFAKRGYDVLDKIRALDPSVTQFRRRKRHIFPLHTLCQIGDCLISKPIIILCHDHVHRTACQQCIIRMFRADLNDCRRMGKSFGVVCFSADQQCFRAIFRTGIPIIYRIILFQALFHRLRNSHTLCLRGICGNFERTLCCLLDLRG